MPQYSSREIRQRLRRYDSRFEFINRGGRHQWIIFHPDIDGEERSCPLPDHGSKSLSKHVVASIRRRFNIPRDVLT